MITLSDNLCVSIEHIRQAILVQQIPSRQNTSLELVSNDLPREYLILLTLDNWLDTMLNIWYTKCPTYLMAAINGSNIKGSYVPVLSYGCIIYYTIPYHVV